MMTDRVRRLRGESVETRPYVSTERAELVTAFYQGDVPRQVSAPVCRALALRHVMENKTICINPGELIVGERGPAPKATPTYPELCCHTLEDLEVLDRRRRTPFRVSAEAMEVYRDVIIPFWNGRTLRDRLLELMSPAWHDAFNAGVFTEFMEQRSPGHAILDGKIYRRGLVDVKAEIASRQAQLDYLNDPQAYARNEEYKAMSIACDAILVQSHRHAALARQMAEIETDLERKAELLKIGEICARVPGEAPRTFHEALQAYWFVHLGVVTELNTWDSFNPGRLDQHLEPYYRQEMEAGTLTREQAEELLQCFWVKFNNQPAPPKVGVTEHQSGTYTDFALINVGGVKPDGSDAVNEVSYLVLDVVKEMQLTQPSSCIQVSHRSPDRFVRHACEVVRTGLGQPSIFNSDVIQKEMLHDGKTLADARSGGPSGCVEVSAFGKESCTLTGYCNWPKILELALNDGVDPASGKRLGPATGDPRRFGSLDEVLAAYRVQLKHFIDIKIAGNNVIERLFAERMPAPYMSLLVDDCVARGKDYHDGGPRYNPTYIQGVGMGTTVDALAAIKHHCFEEKSIPLAELLEALAANFEGREDLRQRLVNKSPRYGNDDPRADDLAAAVFEAYYETVNGRPNTKGGKYRINLLPTTVHVYFGSVVGATANGRKAGVTVSEGISPTQGADTKGPTAVLKSAARIDHARTGGTLLNMKFTPNLLEGEGLDRLVKLVRSYFRMDGHHIQFNVVDAATLRRAQAFPEEYRNLIVRVAGYSDYFNDVGPELQEEIISRTEQQTL
ncbi:MAG: trans-4-hydroxy-L-proline dehydratase [Thermoguttaceae bacterium]